MCHDIELLISEVQLNPCKWDLGNKLYSDREEKKAWDQVALKVLPNWEVMGMSDQKKNRK